MIALITLIVNGYCIIYTEYMENFKITNKKEFMNKLLNKDTFDDFLLKEALIITSTKFHIDGMEVREFYDNDEDVIKIEAPYDYAPWSRLRPLVLTLIKGKHTPVSLKISLYLKPDLVTNVAGDKNGAIDYLVANILYGNGELNVTTGVAYREFTLDKEEEKAWDAYIGRMIEGLGVG